MTGHGEAHRHEDGLSIAAEIRTVNNRYFKLNLRLTEGYAPLEPHVESLVRQQIRRGTVYVNVQIDREGFETVGGYLMSHLGRVPAVGERFEVDGLSIEVLDAERRRVNKVRISRVEPADASAIAEPAARKLQA